MIFHTARLATEKQIDPLPADRDFLGNERSIMKYELTIGEATLSLKPSPTVFIKSPYMPGIHSYTAMQFLDCAAVGEDFTIAGQYPDEHDVPINALEVKQFAHWIRSKVGPKVGQFKTVFIENDPRVPF